MAKHALTNTAAGPRGVNTTSGYAELAPGETRTVDLDAGELASAQAVGYFSFGKGSGAAAIPSPPDNDGNGEAGGSLPNNPLQLKKLAKDEGIDVPEGTTKAADIKAVILAGRKAKLAEQASAGGGQSDDLDAMDDETLRNTAAAITGKPVAELADQDRDALLRLARGEA